MIKIYQKIATAILLSLVINAPFAIGEYLTRETVGPRAYFPFQLFAVLWIEMAVVVYVLMFVIQTFWNGEANKKIVRLALQIIIVGLFAWAWVFLIIDQWPCFFYGGRGC